MNYSYCQRQIEGGKFCKLQCNHCKQYYSPLEKTKMKNTINQVIKEAHKRTCRKKMNLNYSPNSAEIQEEINLMEAEPPKSKKEKRGRKTTSPESLFLLCGKLGATMYSLKQGKDIEALMSYYKKDATTEVCYCVCPRTLQTEKLTKVTIL